MKVLLLNAISMYAEEYSDRYNTDSEFMEFLYGDLGTDAKEMQELDIDLSDIFMKES